MTGAPETPIEVADQIIEWVRGSVPDDEGIETRDRNDRLLVAAYGRAYRCFVSIRELAGRGEADDSAILTRALLSVALQSLYLAMPDDPVERDRRFRRAGRTYFEKFIKAAREEAAAGGVLDEADVERAERTIERFKAEGTPPLPNDYDIARELNAIPFYTRVYRTGSDVAHYSIGAALDGFLELTHSELIGGAALEMPDDERALDVLLRACLTYGFFLEQSERILDHGLTSEVERLLREYINAHPD
jgi:hypothetical protein